MVVATKRLALKVTLAIPDPNNPRNCHYFSAEAEDTQEFEGTLAAEKKFAAKQRVKLRDELYRALELIVKEAGYKI